MKVVILIFLLVSSVNFAFSTQGINLNTATYTELVALPGVTPQLAHAILLYRKKYKLFIHPREILNAAAEAGFPIGEDHLQHILSRVRVYAVPRSIWASGQCSNYHMLISPVRAYNISKNLLFCFPDGGYLLVKNTPLSMKEISKIKSFLPVRLFRKKFIDWLVVNDVRGLPLLTKHIEFGSTYASSRLAGISMEHYVNYVDTETAIDLFQQEAISATLVPEAHILRVGILYGRNLVDSGGSSPLLPALKDVRRLFVESQLFFDSFLWTVVSREESSVIKPREMVVPKSIEEIADDIHQQVLDDISDGF